MNFQFEVKKIYIPPRLGYRGQGEEEGGEVPGAHQAAHREAMIMIRS